MQIFHTITQAQTEIKNWRKSPVKIALVPTMGNLHTGHLSLIELAQKLADKVVVSIFVNPLQFGVNEDFDQYPRTETKDLHLLEQQQVSAVFLPEAHTMYREERSCQTKILVPELTQDLCAVTRPDFFAGVATVVAKLFHIITPDIAVFGEKDYQQLLVIKKMVQDLNFAIEIAQAPIVRESDGLAMSSRNQYLTAGERQIAPKLYDTLKTLAATLKKGDDFHARLEAAWHRLTNSGFKVDYLTIRRPQELQPVGPDDEAGIILTACYLGKTRLIDNIQCKLIC